MILNLGLITLKSLKIYAVKYKVKQLSSEEKARIKRIMEQKVGYFISNRNEISYFQMDNFFKKWKDDIKQLPSYSNSIFKVESAPINSNYFILFDLYEKESVAKVISKKLFNEGRNSRVIEQTINIDRKTLLDLIEQLRSNYMMFGLEQFREDLQDANWGIQENSEVILELKHD